LAWEALNCFPDVSTAFNWTALNPFTQFDDKSKTFWLLEIFIIVLYYKKSNTEFVDEAQMKLFCKDNKAMENIPPTSDALLQRAKQTAHQAT